MALVLPPILAIGCVAVISMAERSGTTLFIAEPPANLAEAAATGRADDVVRRLDEGEDRWRVYDLRPDVISSAVLRATPTEAAMWSRQLLMVQLLDRAGAIRDAEERRGLACLAADLDLEDIVEYLMPSDAAGCVPQAARDAVLARTPR
jgi:hypothetical protein